MGGVEISGLIGNFDLSINTWISGLDHYSIQQLLMKPAPDSWSLGQVYMHLLDDTRYYVDQIRICVSTDDHAHDEAISFARGMLAKNEFPDEALKGAPDHNQMPQPVSIDQLKNDLLQLKSDMHEVARIMAESPFSGKTKHPGFNYFNANEWLQFADMHFRHHLRQKRRIDEFLKLDNSVQNP